MMSPDTTAPWPHAAGASPVVWSRDHEYLSKSNAHVSLRSTKLFDTPPNTTILVLDCEISLIIEVVLLFLRGRRKSVSQRYPIPVHYLARQVANVSQVRRLEIHTCTLVDSSSCDICSIFFLICFEFYLGENGSTEWLRKKMENRAGLFAFLGYFASARIRNVLLKCAQSSINVFMQIFL